MAEMIPVEKKIARISNIMQSQKFKNALLARLKDSDTMEVFAQSLWLSIQRNPDLIDCTPQSLVIAALQAAALRLPIDGLSNYAHIVPYAGVAQFQIGYKGLQKRATRSGRYVEFEVHPVFKGDHFKVVRGLNPILEHIPKDDAERTWETLEYAYCIVERKDGKKLFHYMTKTELIAFKNRSKARSGPWSTDPIPMALKTVCKQLCKQLDLDAETMQEIKRDELREVGEADGEAIDVDVQDIVASGLDAAEAKGAAKAKTKLDKLTEQQKAALAQGNPPGAANGDAQGSTPAAATPEPPKDPNEPPPPTSDHPEPQPKRTANGGTGRKFF